MLRKAFHISKVAELYLWVLNIGVVRCTVGMMKMGKKYVESPCGQIINNVCNILGISYDTCHCILSEDTNKRQAASKCVLSLLNDDHKQN